MHYEPDLGSLSEEVTSESMIRTVKGDAFFIVIVKDDDIIPHYAFFGKS